MVLGFSAMEAWLWVFTAPMIETPDELKISLIVVMMLQPVILGASYWLAWITAWAIFRLFRSQP